MRTAPYPRKTDPTVANDAGDAANDLPLQDLDILRQRRLGSETVLHLEDPQVYRTLCERLFAAGYDFPQCLSGVDMSYGLRTVLNLRRLADHAEITLWLDVSYENPHTPSVTDLWGGVEWHEREAYDLLGIRYDGHPDLRRILLEDHWTIHPLQRRYDTGGYLIPDWEPQPWPDWDAIERAEAEAAEKAKAKKAPAKKSPAKPAIKPAAEAAPKPTEVAKQPPPKQTRDVSAKKDVSTEDVSKKEGVFKKDVEQDVSASDAGAERPATERPSVERDKADTSAPDTPTQARKDDLKQIRGIGAKLEQTLNDAGITTLEQLANLTDEQMAALSDRLAFPGRIEREKWREQAQALLEKEDNSDDSG